MFYAWVHSQLRYTVMGLWAISLVLYMYSLIPYIYFCTSPVKYINSMWIVSNLSQGH